MTEDSLPLLLLRAWAERLGEVLRVERLSERKFVFQVTTHERAWILKEAGLVNPQGDAARKLAADAALLRYLQGQGIPVAVPEPTADGQPYLLREGRCFTLTPALPNEFSAGVSPARLQRNIGAAVARLHQALDGYRGLILSWTMDLPQAIFEQCVPVILRHQDEEKNDLLRIVVDEFRQPFIQHTAGLPWQYQHGDCHGGNILRVGEEVTGFIDLDHLPYGPRVFDLAYYLMNEAIHLDAHPEQAGAWLDVTIPNLLAGYAEVSPLSRAERAAIPYLLVGYLLVMSAWLYEPLDIPEWATGDMRVFHWLYQHFERVAESCLLPSPSTL